MRELPQGLTPPRNARRNRNRSSSFPPRHHPVWGRRWHSRAAGCSTSGDGGVPVLDLDNTVTGSVPPMRPAISVDKNITSADVMYASLTDNGLANVPGVPYLKVKPEFRRQIVVDTTGGAAPSSSIKARCSIWCSRVAMLSATVSASARTASAGPAAPTSSMAGNGRPGRRRQK